MLTVPCEGLGIHNKSMPTIAEIEKKPFMRKRRRLGAAIKTLFNYLLSIPYRLFHCFFVRKILLLRITKRFLLARISLWTDESAYCPRACGKGLDGMRPNDKAAICFKAFR